MALNEYGDVVGAYHVCENCDSDYECIEENSEDCFCSEYCPGCEYIWDKEWSS